MTKAFYITFNTTHNTMKANKLLKRNYDTEVVSAPKELNESGCSIAVKISQINSKDEILNILSQNNLKILNETIL